MQKKDFKLENSIYDEAMLKIAIKDFEWFDIKYSKSVLTIFWNSTEEIEEIFNELMNYTLWIQNETI